LLNFGSATQLRDSSGADATCGGPCRFASRSQR
jgi:hypothetical protein